MPEPRDMSDDELIGGCTDASGASGNAVASALPRAIMRRGLGL